MFYKGWKGKEQAFPEDAYNRTSLCPHTEKVAGKLGVQ